MLIYAFLKGGITVVKIMEVTAGSRAARAGILAGDVLVSLNGEEINDALDYHFYLANKSVAVTVQRGDEILTVHINKGEYDDIGLEFATPLMDKKHCCANKCVFCFIDQLPRGMRSSLYFKDDDDRLSFLHGNYVTLTNLHDRDIDRIIKMHISPINVSVHTTNPELRVRMMKNPRAGEVLSYLRRLSDAGIRLCTQIVLCKGLNDKGELERTMHDLLSYRPSLTSCAIVPAGLTRHREGLYPLEDFTPQECEEVIERVEHFADTCLDHFGSRIFYCSDEFYVRAAHPRPSDEYYESYPQIENGVGMLTNLETEFHISLKYLIPKEPRPARTVSIVTGSAAYDTICSLVHRLCVQAPYLTVHVHRAVNNFFGQSVTVAGLLTGGDVYEQLKDRELGELLLFPAAMLRAGGDVFLDDMTPEELSKKLGVPVCPVKNDGEELAIRLLGVEDEYPVD